MRLQLVHSDKNSDTVAVGLGVLQIISSAHGHWIHYNMANKTSICSVLKLNSN